MMLTEFSPLPGAAGETRRGNFMGRLGALHRGGGGDPDEPSFFSPLANEDEGLGI